MSAADLTLAPGIRILCGDALALMPGLGAVDHIITDPPYEQRLHDAKAGRPGRRMRRDGGAEPVPLGFGGIDAIRADFVAQAAASCRGWLLAFCTIEGVAPWAEAINAAPGIRYKRACLWIKPDAAPQFNGQGPAQGAEVFVSAWCGRGFSRWNGGGKRGLYTHLTNPPDRCGAHETEKPWRLMRDLILDFTRPGDLILDPFMGSDTTLVAAALTGRRAIGIEINPVHFETARQRIAGAIAAARANGVQATAQVQEALL